MQEVIELALQRAQRKGLNIPETAELIIDFMDIRGLRVNSGTSVVMNNIGPSSNPPPASNGPLSAKYLDGNGTNSISPPPFPIESVITSTPEQPLWNQDDLYNSLYGMAWSFECQPEGWAKPTTMGGVVAKKGEIGVVVEFRCLDMDRFDRTNLFPVFIGLNAGQIDPDVIIKEAKEQAMQLLRRRQSRIEPNTVPIHAYPSDFSSIGGAGGGFGSDALPDSQLQWEKSHSR